MPLLLSNPGNAGVAPGPVTSLVPGAASSTTLAASYVAPSGGTSALTFSGFTSPHGSGVWTQNTGVFGAAGGTLVGLAPNTSYDLRIVVQNAAGLSQTDYLLGVTTSPAAASAFTLTSNASHGPAGSPVVLTATPTAGGWPAGEVVVPSASGLAGTFDNVSLVGSGTASLVFTFSPVSGPGVTGSFSVSAAGMTNGTGALGYTIDAVVGTGTASRFDAVAGASAVAPGAAVSITLSPNGNWPASGTIVPSSSSSGAFSPATLSLAGGAAPITLSYTPSVAGEHNVSFASASGLHVPYPVPINAFNAAGGSALGLAATLLLGDQSVHQRDAPAGNPSGFSIAETQGWGEVWVSVGAIGGSTTGLFAKLFDAQSTGATSTVGTGTALHSTPVQVYGAVTGAGTVRLLLPAVRNKLLFLDLATDAAFTNPIRITKRFKVGTVIAVATRSQLTGWFRGYAEAASAAPTVPWQQTAVAFAADYRYGDDGTWYRIDGALGDPSSYNSKVYGEPCSNASMEAGRLVDQQLKTMLGVVGVGATSGGLDQFVSAAGALSSAFVGTVAGACRSKFRFLVIAATGMDNSVETAAGDLATYNAAIAAIPSAYPTVAVIGWNTGASGIFGSDGSQAVAGYVRNQAVFINQIEPTNPMVTALCDHAWNAFAAGHSTQAARLQFIREHVRLLLSVERSAWGGLQTSNRGPTVATAGTRASGTNVIRIGYKLNGGTRLIASKIAFTSDTTYTLSIGTATATNIASLLAVYAAGGYVGNGMAIKVSGVSINTTAPPVGYDGTLDITLAGAIGTVTYADGSTAATPTMLTVQMLSDFGASGGDGVPANVTTVLHSDYDPLSVGLGALLRPQLDIAITTV